MIIICHARSEEYNLWGYHAFEVCSEMFIFFNKIELFTVGLLYIFIDHLRESKTQTVDYCFHHANENVRTMVPLFSKPDETIVRSQSAESAF